MYLYSVILAIIPIDLISPCPTFQLKHLVDLHKNSWFTFNTYMTHPLHLFCTSPRNTGVHNQYYVLLYLSSILVIVMFFFSRYAYCVVWYSKLLHVTCFTLWQKTSSMGWMQSAANTYNFKQKRGVVAMIHVYGLRWLYIFVLGGVSEVLCIWWCNRPLACWLNHYRERSQKFGAVVVNVLSCIIWTRQH